MLLKRRCLRSSAISIGLLINAANYELCRRWTLVANILPMRLFNKMQKKIDAFIVLIRYTAQSKNFVRTVRRSNKTRIT